MLGNDTLAAIKEAKKKPARVPQLLLMKSANVVELNRSLIAQDIAIEE